MICNEKQFDAIAKDSSYHNLGTLPSQGIPYKGRMEKLFIRPFRLSELMLLSKSAQLKELGPLIRAVDNCISYDVNDLTIGDFYYIIFWLRMYSMPDSPYIIEWHCTQPYFTHKTTGNALLYSEPEWPTAEVLTKEYNAVICDVHNTSVVNFPQVEVLTLEEGFELPEGFDFPRVRILESLNAALLDAEMAFLAPAIQWLEGLTWEDKVKKANEDSSNGFSLFREALDLNKNVVHGIVEEATFNCRKCRVEHKQILKLNALTFFQ